jgi:uncharacterized Tic20 family protein
MDSSYIINIINVINQDLYEQTEDDELYLEYSTNAFADVVEFLGLVIWNSEDDMRPYIDEDEKEDLNIYLRKEINRTIQKLEKIKL